MPFDPQRVQELFFAARQIADPAERADWLTRNCGDDSELHQRVTDLLAADAAPQAIAIPSTVIPSLESIAVDLPSGTIIAEKYKLLEILGEGGMGTVWLAEQFAPVKRKVALKLVKPGMDSREVLARFQAERQALALMDHPHIAHVFDGGLTPQGRPFFVMEYVKGVPLTKYCDEARLSLRERLQLFIPVCQAVQHAHQKGIIHRDLKPSNVLVALYDGRPVPKVIDFGLAKALEQPLTEQTLFTAHGQMLGTPLYMSPEQAELNNLDIDTRSDIYSLGVMLYELLTGQTPLELKQLRAGAFDQMLRMIRENEPVRPSLKVSSGGAELPSVAAQRRLDPAQLFRLIRGDLDWIVMRSLEKDRGRRYATASDFVRDLERYLGDEPVSAGPPGFLYRARKWSRRHRQQLALATMVLIGLSGIVLWSWSESRAAQQRMEAQSRLLSNMLEDAAGLLARALAAPIGNTAEWEAAVAVRERVADFSAVPDLLEADRQRVDLFLARFAQAAESRKLARLIEEVVIQGATQSDRGSWLRLEEQFRELFRQRGLDLEQRKPLEIAAAIRSRPDAAPLTDALELWLGAVGQLGMLGSAPLTREQMQQWAEALYAADPDPVRTGIRRMIYSGQPPKIEQVEALIRDVKLPTLTPRTLAWLANVFLMTGSMARCDNVFRTGLRQYPSDFLLSFEWALTLQYQSRWQEAIRLYTRCLALRPDVPGIWRSLGICLRHTQEWAAAEDALLRAIELAPQHAPTHADLAETSLAQQKWTAALEQAQAAAKLDAELAEAQSIWGRALMGLKQYAEALPHLEQCRDLAVKHKNPLLRKQAEGWITDCKAQLP